MSERNERIRAELIALIDSDKETKRRDGKPPCAAFAKRIGVSKQVVWRWVNRRSGINAENLEKIRAVYPDFAK